MWQSAIWGALPPRSKLWSWATQGRFCSIMHIREAFFCSRQLKVAEMDGRVGVKNKRETEKKRSAGAADDQDFSKIARPKKESNFRPPQNERAG